MKIEVLDLGINNLNSVIRVFENSLAVNDTISVAKNASESIKVADLLVLPGLGSFAAGMYAIRSGEFDVLISEHIFRGGKIVGICLGMQLLGSSSEESENISGLDLIPGKTVKLTEQKGERIPNVGWLETKKIARTSNFDSLASNRDFYFVHSYEYIPINPDDILCTSLYGKREFVSGINSGNVCGFQFHPEKSSKVGKLLVEEIVDWSKNEV